MSNILAAVLQDQAISVLQLGPWILWFLFFKQAPRGVKSLKTGKHFRLTVGVDNWIFNLYFHRLWLIWKEKQTQSIYIHPLCLFVTESEMPLCKLTSFVSPGVSSKWKTFQKQDHIKLHALSSVVGTLAAAWVRSRCQMGGKTYHRAAKIQKSNLA